MDNLSTGATPIRLAFSSLIGSAGGIQAVGGLSLSQKGTPNMSVIVNGGTPAEGALWVPGSVTPSQGTYFCWNDADYEQTIETAGASNPRIDTIIARVYDADYTGGSEKKWTIEALKGKEESGVTLAAKKSSPAAVPASSYVLGYVLVSAKATTVVTADIENVATRFGLGTGVWTPLESLNAELEELIAYGIQSTRVRLEDGGASCRLRGGFACKHTLSPGAALATLPIGFRPTGLITIYVVFGLEFAILTISTAGVMKISKEMVTGEDVYFDGVTFNLI
jgi:hypothetical protein